MAPEHMFREGVGDDVLEFGGLWTLIKLDVVEEYLNFFTTALKRQGFKLCYIDAFAGEGEYDVKNLGPTTGSALRALDYPFDRYVWYLFPLSALNRNLRLDGRI